MPGRPAAGARSDARTDVLVIGAGHNGLVTACYLADAGFDVTVVEAAHEIGGMSRSGRPIETAPDHVVNYCATDLAFWSLSPVDAELDLRRFGLRTVSIDPLFVQLEPDGSSLALWHDPRRTAEEIRYFSARDAAAFLDYARLLDRIVQLARPLMTINVARPDAEARRVLRDVLRHVRPVPELARWAASSGENYIAARFEHPTVRAALANIAATYNPIQARGTTMAHLALGILHCAPSERPLGGMQAVPEALARRLQSSGGIIHIRARVAEILLGAGRATGVRLDDGQVITAAHAVVATCDPRTLFDRLLPGDALPRRLRRRAGRIPTNASGSGQLSVSFALDGPVLLRRHQKLRRDDLDLRIPYGLIGDGAHTARAQRASAAGELPSVEDLPLFVSVLSALDPTQAPVGQDVVYAYVPSVPLSPRAGWTACETNAADRVRDRASQFYDGLAEFEIGRHVESPTALAARTGATDGAIFHVDMDLWHAGPLRPALGLGNFRLPVRNLYLGGAGAHPTGGVTGLPGRLAAREILRKTPAGTAAATELDRTARKSVRRRGSTSMMPY